MGFSFTWGGDDFKTATDTTAIDTKVNITSLDRPLKKPQTRHKVEIPGRAGSWDFGGSVERDYLIDVDFVIVGEDSAGVMTRAGNIETFFETTNETEELIFDDSTDVVHNAQVYEAIELSPEGPGNIARGTITFECQAYEAT